jgi:hypothetical protein
MYRRIYLDRLWDRIRDRLIVRKRATQLPTNTVPASRALLDRLRARGTRLYLASGTDEEYMKHEVELLRLTPYFDGGVFGAIDDYRAFSKVILIRRIIDSTEFTGGEFLGFGGGYVEEITEPECRVVDEWKRRRLIGVGADFIAPNCLNLDEMVSSPFPD